LYLLYCLITLFHIFIKPFQIISYLILLFKSLNSDTDFNFKKLASPTEPMPLTYSHKEKATKKILWASRICNQKLFDVFEKVVNSLPEYQFTIYGGEPEEENNKLILSRLLTLPNVEFLGEYQHIDKLDINAYDLYLFTSKFEGIPTIILDMAMLGIPIVSANVGGISEVLGRDYPLLVQESDNDEAYVEKIRYFYRNEEEVLSKTKKIREYIIEAHNESTFQSEYKSIVENFLHDNR